MLCGPYLYKYMYKRITAFLFGLLLALGAYAAPATVDHGELNPSGEPEYKDGVYVGNTSAYETDSTVPADKGVTVASNPDLKQLTQKQKADQLAKNDPFGGALTIMSMVIVVLALVVLSILFLCFGRISSAMQKRRKKEAHGPAAADAHEEEDSGEVIAAIAAAMAEHYSGKHDMEDYILTIRSMKRSYSPWNSKIYNLRVLPQIKH